MLDGLSSLPYHTLQYINISIYPYDSGELQDYMNPSDPSYQLGGGWTLVCLALLLQLLFR